MHLQTRDEGLSCSSAPQLLKHCLNPWVTSSDLLSLPCQNLFVTLIFSMHAQTESRTKHTEEVWVTGCPKSRQIQCSVITPSHWVLRGKANKVPEPLSYEHWFHPQGRCPLWFSHFPQTPPSHGAHRRVKSQHWMFLLICWLGPSFLSSSVSPFPASSLHLMHLHTDCPRQRRLLPVSNPDFTNLL